MTDATHQASTEDRTRVATTWGFIQNGDILDGYEVTEEPESNEYGQVRVYQAKSGWTPWRSADQPVSVYR